MAAHDQKGPSLRAFITLNPNALTEASRLEAVYKSKNGPIGPLHGSPIVLQDNFKTKDMTSTGGNLAMKNSRPAADACVVERMRRADAIILGKTT
jgi:Asp-tRNA(Asn)/Glu-tRNA(Gln) amidotransferase A subunit family amidase